MLLDMLGLKNEADLNVPDIARDLYVDPAGRKKLLERLEHDGAIQNAEYELLRADGGVITVLENARVVRGEDGAVLYYEGTLTDITDRKRMEEQLRQAQKTEALGRMAGGIAHDFSNVLTVIGGFAKLAVSELPVSHPARASAGQVVEATESAMALTRQLLSFSQRSARPETTDLNRVLQRVESSLMAGGGARLLLCLSSEPILVHARGSEIEEIAAQLIAAVAVGARQGTDISPVEVRTMVLNLGAEFARVYPDIEPGLYAALCIFPSPARHMEDSPRDCLLKGLVRPLSGNEGAAPDLLRARELATNLGGFLAAGPYSQSDNAGPTGMHAFLPCIAVAGAADSAGATKSAGGETILLVEDEPLVRELSRDMLERQGYRVIVAADALEAERISGRPPGFDLLITDSVMPAMTGPELARCLRTSHPALKVLYIAGYTDPPLRHEDMAVAGSSQIEKPFSADALGRKVRQMLDRS
jgi:CheY-like chemotaxis protein